MIQYQLKDNLGNNVNRSLIVPLAQKKYAEFYHSRNYFTGEERFKFEEGNLIFITGEKTIVSVEPFDVSKDNLKKTLMDKVLALSENFKLEEIKNGN